MVDSSLEDQKATLLKMLEEEREHRKRLELEMARERELRDKREK